MDGITTDHPRRARRYRRPGSMAPADFVVPNDDRVGVSELHGGALRRVGILLDDETANDYAVRPVSADRGGGHADFDEMAAGVIGEIDLVVRIVEVPTPGPDGRQGRHVLQEMIVKKQIFRIDASATVGMFAVAAVPAHFGAVGR